MSLLPCCTFARPGFEMPHTSESLQALTSRQWPRVKHKRITTLLASAASSSMRQICKHPTVKGIFPAGPKHLF